MVSYCLFCNTNRCRQIASEIQRRFGLTAYSPTIIQRKWIKGTCHEETKDYLPGYVFVYAQAPVLTFREIKSIDGVLRFLGATEEAYILNGADRRFAEMIHQNHGQIGIFQAFQVGGRVCLTGNSLAGAEGEIVKLDRRKGRAQIQFHFDGRSFRIWAGIDLLQNK